MLDCRAIFLPWSTIAANRNHRVGMSPSDGSAALLRIVSAIAADSGDPLMHRDLREQRGQYRSIANRVGGDLDRPDLQCFGIDAQVHLAPLATIGGTVLARLPFPFTIILIPVLSTSRCKPPELGRPHSATVNVFCRRHSVV